MPNLKLLHEKYLDAYKRRDFIKAASYMRQIDKLKFEQEHVPLSSIFESMSKEDIRKSSDILRKVPVYADLMESSMIDLIEILRRTDDSISLPLMKKCRNIKQQCREIVRLIDEQKSESFSDSFGEICDYISSIVDEEFSRRDRIEDENNA